MFFWEFILNAIVKNIGFAAIAIFGKHGAADSYGARTARQTQGCVFARVFPSIFVQLIDAIRSLNLYAAYFPRVFYAHRSRATFTRITIEVRVTAGIGRVWCQWIAELKAINFRGIVINFKGITFDAIHKRLVEVWNFCPGFKIIVICLPAKKFWRSYLMLISCIIFSADFYLTKVAFDINIVLINVIALSGTFSF